MSDRSRHLVLVGAGGNIGSHLVPHLARMPEVGRLTLIDRDIYEHRNRLNQEMPPGAAGRKKAAVQAARARRINPALAVTAIAEDVEALPLGALRSDLILAGLDSRRARQRVNQAAWILGIPWLDGGVLATGLLARVTRYLPGDSHPCLECRWDAADYAALEQSYPCDGPTPANRAPAPASLGALAASLLALECRKLLLGEGSVLDPGSELVLDAAHHRHYVTSARRNPGCRLAQHAPWNLQPLAVPAGASLGSLLDTLRERADANGDLALTVEGQRIVRRLSCERCGAVKRVLRLAGRLGSGDRRCRSCGGRTVLNGFGLIERLEAAALTREERDRPLARLGLRPGEIVTAEGAKGPVHFELVTR
ncbi:MAG TPA: ThiF family adenylyltransferase [Gemmatimonadales bacterium]|nr:ThiF family adenylyltransferase [Gemmatimonadales bacterium]